MIYFQDESGVYAYDETQVAAGLGAGKTAMTPEEVEAHINPPKTAEQVREEWKSARSAAVEAIKVTTLAGNTFDGDEVSQGRMARAVSSMEAADTVLWVLADNTVIQASRAELKEALRLAGSAQAAIWVME